MVKSCPAGLYLQLRLRRWLRKRFVMGLLETVDIEDHQRQIIAQHAGSFVAIYHLHNMTCQGLGV